MSVIDLTKDASPIVAFKEAVDNSAPGVKIIYHRGRVLAGSRMARVALEAFETGQVELVQRRDTPSGFFEFIAIKRKVLR